MKSEYLQAIRDRAFCEEMAKIAGYDGDIDELIKKAQDDGIDKIAFGAGVMRFGQRLATRFGAAVKSGAERAGGWFANTAANIDRAGANRVATRATNRLNKSQRLIESAKQDAEKAEQMRSGLPPVKSEPVQEQQVAKNQSKPGGNKNQSKPGGNKNPAVPTPEVPGEEKEKGMGLGAKIGIGAGIAGAAGAGGYFGTRAMAGDGQPSRAYPQY